MIPVETNKWKKISITDEKYWLWLETQVSSDLEWSRTVICKELEIECGTCALQNCEVSIEIDPFPCETGLLIQDKFKGWTELTIALEAKMERGTEAAITLVLSVEIESAVTRVEIPFSWSDHFEDLVAEVDADFSWLFVISDDVKVLLLTFNW